jgi:hypothetical protein
MTWFAFQGYNGGKAVDIAGSQEKEAAALGFHGYATQAQAQANPNSVNILNSWAVNEMIADYAAAVKEGAEPGGPNADIYNPATAVKAGAQYVESSIPWLADIGDLFSRLTSKQLWLRAAEIAIGGLLLMIGLNKALGNPAAKVATTVRKATVW